VKDEVVLTLPLPIDPDSLLPALDDRTGTPFPMELNGLSEF